MRAFLRRCECRSVVLGLLLAGCGGGASQPRVNPATNDGSAVVTAAAGGTVSLANGPQLDVPPAAVASTETITIEDTGQTAPGGGSIYAFGPSGTTFGVPATVTFPNSQGLTDATVYWSQPGSTTAFTALPATVTAATISAQVTHFSEGFVGPPCTESAACTPANACHVGAMACSSGAPVCNDTTANMSDGTSCGTGSACQSGTCSSLPFTSVTISPLEAVVTAGSTLQFTATGYRADASTADVTATATWSSSDEAVATITTVGLASAAGSSNFGETSTTITASVPGENGTISASTLLSVCGAQLPPGVGSGCGDISVTPDSLVEPGSTITITVTQGSGSLCGGGFSMGVSVPGTFTSAPGGAVSGTSVNYGSLQSGSVLRTAIFQVSSNPSDWQDQTKCPTGEWAPNGNGIFMTSGPWVSASTAWYVVAAPFSVSQ